MAVDAVRLHPYQNMYFNFLTDRRTPEHLRTQYEMQYGAIEYRSGLEYLLARFPDATLRVDGDSRNRLRYNWLILPAEARRRIVIADDAAYSPQFVISPRRGGNPFAPILYTERIYRNTVLAVTAVDLPPTDDAAAVNGYHAAFRAAVAGEPLLRSQFDFYLDGAALTYVKQPCRPEDVAHPFLLRAVPVAVEDLPVTYRARGWHPLGFRFGMYGVRFDGRCLIRRPLPDYPIRALEVGRWLPDLPGLRLLEAVIDLTPAQPPVRAGAYWSAHAAIESGERGAPDSRTGFDLYLDTAGAELTYHKEPCAPDDLRGRFYLHVFPADPAELAAHERQSGFAHRSFFFPERGVMLMLPGGACVALVPLPAWEHGIARVRASQSNRWSVEFPAGE